MKSSSTAIGSRPASRAAGSRLLTRSGLDWTGKFGEEIINVFKALPVSKALIDGELVVENAAGASDFSALQADLSEGRTDRFLFYAFDLLYLDGYDLREAPLVARKAALERLVGAGSGVVRLSGHFDESGEVVLQACLPAWPRRNRLEAARFPLSIGAREKSWIKSKCSARQEFVVAGFVPSTAARQGDRLAGSRRLRGRRSALRGEGRNGLQRVCGASALSAARADAHRLEPFRWSIERRGGAAGALRAAGARRGGRLSRLDRRQRPAPCFFRRAARGQAGPRGGPRDGRGGGGAESAQGAERGADAPAPHGRADPSRSRLLARCRRHQGRPRQLLHRKSGRSWRRSSSAGRSRSCAARTASRGSSSSRSTPGKGSTAALSLSRTQRIRASRSISVRDLDGLIGLVQAATLEIHPWGSTATDWERPDMIIMDLDPGESVAWEAMIEARAGGSRPARGRGARRLREDVRRQGPACRLAGEAESRMAGGQGVHEGDRQLDGRRQS